MDKPEATEELKNSGGAHDRPRPAVGEHKKEKKLVFVAPEPRELAGAAGRPDLAKPRTSHTRQEPATPYAGILRLQRLVGNAAVAKLLASPSVPRTSGRPATVPSAVVSSDGGDVAVGPTVAASPPIIAKSGPVASDAPAGGSPAGGSVGAGSPGGGSGGRGSGTVGGGGPLRGVGHEDTPGSLGAGVLLRSAPHIDFLSMQRIMGNTALCGLLQRLPVTSDVGRPSLRLPVADERGAVPGRRDRHLVQRREVENGGGSRDWTTADRENNTARWKQACLTNLNNLDSSQYVRVVERRDFYRWFYEHTAGLGYTTRWALAARLVADGAHQIADMDARIDYAIVNDTFSMANVELQGMMREGNQIIFDNVFPKLKKLLDGGPVTGAAALRWDMQVLSEEQSLIQPMYERVSQATRDQLDYIARQKRLARVGARLLGPTPETPFNRDGSVPPIDDQANLLKPSDRWRYGMGLGNRFTKGGTGYNPATDSMPAPASGYTDGSELAKVDKRVHLHQLDAWLNPNRFSRVKGESGSDVGAIINGLTDFEKSLVVADRSPDGWAYSTQFAQFGSITETMVLGALPAGRQRASQAASFMDRYRAERKRVEIAVPSPWIVPPF